MSGSEGEPSPAMVAEPEVPQAAPGSEGRAKRERKQVERLTVAPKKEEEFVVPTGTGSKLRDIPNAAFKLGKISGKDELVEGLHNALYRRKGVATTRKKAVLDFSGFAFSADEKERELEARKASMGKWKLELINRLMDALDMPRGSGDKGAKVERLIEFLEAPKVLSEVDLAAKEATKKEKEKAKRARVAAKKEKAKGTTEKAAKRKAAASAKQSPKKKAKKEQSAEPESDEEASELGEDGDASDFEAEVLPTKGSKRRGAAAAEEEEEEEEKQEAAPAKEQADEECQQVSADQLRADIEDILSAMSKEELSALTSKPVLKALQAKYGCSFKPRKGEVADLARGILNKMPAEGPASQEQGAAGAEGQQEESLPPVEQPEEVEQAAKEAAPGAEAQQEAAMEDE